MLVFVVSVWYCMYMVYCDVLYCVVLYIIIYLIKHKILDINNNFKVPNFELELRAKYIYFSIKKINNVNMPLTLFAVPSILPSSCK
jgi:hypothetical protein